MKWVLGGSLAVAICLNLVRYADAMHQRAAALTVPPVPAAAVATPTVATPLPDPAVVAAAKLGAAGLNPAYAGLYLRAQAATGTPWQLLAAVHRLETHQSGDTARRSSAGAVGPMQFLPATFRSYATDGDSDGVADIADVNDAVYSAGRYLAVGGAASGNYRTALYHYNHSQIYVGHALDIADSLGL